MESDDENEMTVEVEEDYEEVEIVEKVQTSFFDLLMEYWFLVLLICVAALYAYKKIVGPRIAKWLQERSDREFEARLHKDPDLVRAREEAMIAARLRMQEQHDILAAKKAEQRKEREQKKREELLARQAGVNVGCTLTDRHSANKPSSDGRSDYNPLMGGGSGGYRPQRRSCPGGGCG